MSLDWCKKQGIKSELHSCTIEIIALLEQEKLIDFSFSKILEADKELRIDNQYYLKNRPVDFDPKKLAEILLKIRNLLGKLSASEIQRIRKIVQAGN